MEERDKYEVTDYWKYENKKREKQVLFLVGDIGWVQKIDWQEMVTTFSEKNQFLLNLKKNIKVYGKFVMVASDPYAYEKNDQFLQLDKQALELSGMSFSDYVLLDNRHKDQVKDILEGASLVFLCGGNTYKQNLFFSIIDLWNYLKNIDCCIVGISAGAMNCADYVLNTSEKIKDWSLPIILSGMGLTSVVIEPHFDKKREDSMLMKMILKESYNRIIYGLPDGSYVCNNIVYGRCYKITNGDIEVFCNDWETAMIKGEI